MGRLDIEGAEPLALEGAETLRYPPASWLEPENVLAVAESARENVLHAHRYGTAGTRKTQQ